MDVKPTVYTGLPEFGYEVDSPLQAFNKYNRHTHSLANPNTFLSEDVNIGDEVTLIGDSGKDVFYRPTPSTKVTVTSITKSTITVSSAASETVNNGDLIVSDGRTIENVSVLLNSASITREPKTGFTTPEVVDAAINKTISIYSEVPTNLTVGSPSTQSTGSFNLKVNNNTISVSGTGINGEQTLPALTLYRGKSYSFNFSETALTGKRIYIITSPSYVLNQNPPSNRYSLGVEEITVNNLVTGFSFNIAYSSPNILYYVCPELSNKVGIINILKSDLNELPWSVGSVQTNISSILSGGLPDFTIPLILKAQSNIRISSINLMPIWSNPFSAGRFFVRVSNSLDQNFSFLTGKQRIDSIGTSSLTAPSKYLEKGSTTQILLYEIEGLKSIFIETNYIYLI